MTIEEFRQRLSDLFLEALNNNVDPRQLIRALRHSANLAEMTLERSDDHEA